MKKKQNEYQVVKTIHKGENANIYLATKSYMKIYYAIKQVNLDKLTSQQIEDLDDSYRILSILNNKFILKFYETFQVKQMFNIVTEYCEGGTLKDYIREEKKKGKKFIKEEKVWSIFIQLVLAVRYMHSRNIMHRNIKPDNIYLTKDFMIRLVNMKTAKELNKMNLYALGMKGTPYYRAPEMWCQRPYGFGVDVWGIGATIYELCALNKPFGGETEEELKNNIITKQPTELSNAYSKELKGVINLMLSKSDLDRPSLMDIIKSYIFISKSKNANLYDYVLKTFPWIEKREKTDLLGFRVKKTDKKKEKTVIKKEELDTLLNNTKIKCSQFFQKLAKMGEVDKIKPAPINPNDRARTKDIMAFITKDEGEGKSTINIPSGVERQDAINDIMAFITKKEGEGRSTINIPGIERQDVINDIMAFITKKEGEGKSTINISPGVKRDDVINDIMAFITKNEGKDKSTTNISPGANQNDVINDIMAFISKNEGKGDTTTNLPSNLNQQDKVNDINKDAINVKDKNDSKNNYDTSNLRNIDNNTKSLDINGQKTFVPLFEGENDEPLDFKVEISSDTLPSMKNDEVPGLEKAKWIEEINEKIIFLSQELVKEIGVEKFMKYLLMLKEKSTTIEALRNDPEFTEDVERNFSNILYYEEEIKRIEKEIYSSQGY